MKVVWQSNVMKQDMEYIKLILQILADNESYFMMLETLAKQVQEKTNSEQRFNDKFIGHFFLAKDTNLVAELGVCFFYRTTVFPSNACKWSETENNCPRTRIFGSFKK